jgi:hypothetical protein
MSGDKEPDEMADHQQCRRFDILVIALIVLGVVGVFTEFAPKALGWFLAFVGFGLNYVRGLCAGVLSSQFFFLKRSVTVDSDESPIAYLFAVCVEGLIVLMLFFATIVSW